MNKRIKCCICGKEVDLKQSSNAKPLMNGRCCQHCNLTMVIPFRKMVENSNNQEELLEYVNENAPVLLAGAGNKLIYKIVDQLKELNYRQEDINRAVISKKVFMNKTNSENELLNLCLEFLKDNKNKN